MKILALEHETSGMSVEQFKQHATREARAVWELYQAGVIREVYFRGDRNEAVLVFVLPSFCQALMACLSRT